jgi:hypothetical protein
MVCQKANFKMLWTDSPTAAHHITDPCKSMLLTEWKSAKDWTPYHVSKLRWLVVHNCGDKAHSQFNYWSDEEESDCEDESDTENRWNKRKRRKSVQRSLVLYAQGSINDS